MAEYNLGTAHGIVEITADTSDLKTVGPELDNITKKGEGAAAAFGKMGTGMMVAGGIIAGGLAVAAGAAASFEKRLSGIAAVSGATAEQMQLIRDKALQIGKDTAFSASEGAQAIEELSKAGIATTDILNGAADATVALAAAGEVDLPQAATIAANSMNQFGLAAEDLVGVTDSIAGAANASAIDVSQFGMSLAQVGAVANLAGLDFNDTAVAIAEMGNAGIVGSDAGTSLKAMLMRLQPQTKKQTRAMEELGLITADGSNLFYDQEGRLKSLGEIQGVLSTALKGMTKAQQQAALTTIFGTDAIRAAAVMAGEGAAGYDKMNTSMHETTAAEVAAKRMDNLAGSVEELKGSAETLAIQLGTILIPVIRTVVDWTTGVVNGFLGMNENVQKFIVIGATVTAGLLLMGGALIKTVMFVQRLSQSVTIMKAAMFASDGALRTNIASMRLHIIATGQMIQAQTLAAASAVKAAFAQGGFSAALKAVAIAARGVLLAFSPWGIIIAAATAGLLIWMQHTADAKARVDALSGSIDTLNGKLTAQGQQTILETLIGEIDPAHWRFMDTLNIGLDEAMVAIQGTEAEMTAYIDKVQAATSVLEREGITASVVTNNIWDWRNATEGARMAQELLAEQTGATADSTEGQIPTLEELQAAAEDAAGGVTELVGGLKELDAALSQSASMDKYREDLASVEAMIKKQGTSLDETTTKGRTNRDSLRTMFGDVASAAESWGKRYGKSQDEIDAKAAQLMRGLRKKLINEGFDEKDLRTFMKGLDALPGQLTSVTATSATTLKTGMTQAGVDGGAGLAAGIASKNPAVISAVNKMTALAIREAQQGLETGSPSKVFIRLGGDVVDGFALGVGKMDGLSDKIKESINKIIAASQERLNKWVQVQKDKLDKAVGLWNDYRASVLSAVTGNVNAGNAWNDTQEQAKRVSDATQDLADAQRDYNEAVAEQAGKDNASPVDTSAVDRAKAELEAAKAAQKDFETNFSSQINDSQLFGNAFSAASAAMIAQFGADSPIWAMLRQNMLAMGPGAGTDLANYLVTNGLTPQMVEQLKNWNMWSGDVATAQAQANYGQGVNMAKDALRGIDAQILAEEERIKKAGKEIGKGMVLGFKSQKGAFKDAVQEYIDAAMAALGVHSPSVVFKDIGMNVARGFELGLRNGMPAVEDAFTALAAVPPSVSLSTGAQLSSTSLAALSAQANAVSIPTPVLNARIYVGDREITDIVRTEITSADESTMAYVMGGR